MMRKLVNGVINSKVHITPTQIASYYNGNIKDFSSPNMCRFKVIFIKISESEGRGAAQSLAENILARIKRGESFDALAAEFSQGPNIDKGGDMGYMAEGSTIPEIEQAMVTMSPGEVSEVIKAEAGFYIVMVVDKKLKGVLPMADVSDIIKERLFQRESELTLREFVSNLKRDAYIKIN